MSDPFSLPTWQEIFQEAAIELMPELVKTAKKKKKPKPPALLAEDEKIRANKKRLPSGPTVMAIPAVSAVGVKSRRAACVVTAGRSRRS